MWTMLLSSSARKFVKLLNLVGSVLYCAGAGKSPALVDSGFWQLWLEVSFISSAVLRKALSWNKRWMAEIDDDRMDGLF